jgi:hypothetical protein
MGRDSFRCFVDSRGGLHPAAVRRLTNNWALTRRPQSCRYAVMSDAATPRSRCIFCAHQQPAEEDRRRDRADGVQSAEERRHDAVESRPGGEACGRAVGLQPVLQAEHLHHPRQPSEAARQEHRQDHLPLHVDSGVARRALVLADGADAVADGGAPREL